MVFDEKNKEFVTQIYFQANIDFKNYSANWICYSK
jgi:hypothetical protein